MCCKQRAAKSQTWNVDISGKAITPPSSMLFPWWMTNKEAQRPQLERKIQLDVILNTIGCDFNKKKYLCIKCKRMMAKVVLYVLSWGCVPLLCLCSASLSALRRYVCNKIWKAEINIWADRPKLVSEVLEIACSCFSIIHIYHGRDTCVRKAMTSFNLTTPTEWN